jgi:hypothetical protein
MAANYHGKGLITLAPGGSMGPRYVLQHLVKSHKIAKNSATTEGREKISTDLESAEF